MSDSKDKKWSCEDIDHVLKLYHEHYEILWNRKHQDYENKKLRKLSLDQFRKDLCQIGIYTPDINFLNQRLKSIRETYRQELKKIFEAKTCTKSSDGLYEPRKPVLKWFETADSFLRDNVKFNTLSSPKTTSKTDFSDSEVINQDDYFVSGSDIQIMDFQNIIGGTENITEVQVTSEPNTNSSPKRKLRKRQAKKAKVRLASPEVQNVSVNHSESIVEEDEYDLFSKHIVSQLRKLPLQSFVMLQEKIQSVITQERLKVIQETQERFCTITKETVAPDNTV